MDDGKRREKFKILNKINFKITLLKVFLTEYAGPLIIYLIFYMRPSFIYGNNTAKYLDVTK